MVAVHQDASGKAKDVALACAKAIGGTKAGVIETTFAERPKRSSSVNRLSFAADGELD